jgi:hypothetical protein
MNEKELRDAITVLRSDRNVKKPTEPVRYNDNGESDSKRKKKFSDNETAAIEIPTTTGQLFRIKVERNGKFFNPLKAGNDYRLDQQDRTTKDLRFQFRSVPESAFGHYVRFLKTRYDSSLLAAEREV